MDFIRKPPEWLTDTFPDLKGFLENGGWWGILAFLAVIALLIVWAILSRFSSLFERKQPVPKDDREIDLDAIPEPAPSTGDRRLTVDGVPVRVRLIVVAPDRKSVV